MMYRNLANGKSRADSQGRDKRIKRPHRDKCVNYSSMECFDPTSAISDAVPQDSASRRIGQRMTSSTGKRVPTFHTNADGHVDLVKWREDFRNISRIVLPVAIQQNHHLSASALHPVVEEQRLDRSFD